MIQSNHVLSAVPPHLRDPLIDEYKHIVQLYMERKWLPTELCGGRFCELVYSVLLGYATNAFPAAPSKPRDFVASCRQLENHSHVPRSFQILIPRMLPALYEVRNNRGVGHVGGDVNPNHMDATAVLGMASWVLAELIRVFHQLSTADAQRVVDLLIERRIPAVWQIGDVKRVLHPELPLREQLLLLIYSCPHPVSVDELFSWTEHANKTYQRRLLRELHQARLIELHSKDSTATILPPGARYVDTAVIPRFRDGEAIRE